MFGNAQDRGTQHQFPFALFDRAVAAPGNDFYTPAWFSYLGAYWWYEDFLWDAFDIDEHPLAIYDHSPTGTPTQGLVADATGGQFQFKLTANSQIEGVGFTQGDNLYIQGNLPFLFLTRLKIVHTMAANEIIVFGLASDMNTLTFDNVTRNLWFRVETDTDLMVEADDNTDDTDDKDTGIDLTADTFYWFAIERTRSGKVFFHVAEDDGNNARVIDFGKVFSVVNPAFGANNLQPVVMVSKSTGTTQPEVIIDVLAYYGMRA